MQPNDNDTRHLVDALERDTGARIMLLRSRDDLVLHMIVVPKGRRGAGVGTRIMDALVEHADERGMRMRLTPAKWGTTSRTRLVKFYKRFGFVENKGRHKDFVIGAAEMYRVPRVRHGRAGGHDDLAVFDDPRGPKKLPPAQAARMKRAGLIAFERGGWVLTVKGLEAQTARLKRRA